VNARVLEKIAQLAKRRQEFLIESMARPLSEEWLRRMPPSIGQIL